VSSDPNAFQNAEVAKLTAADRERDLRQRTEKVKETLESLADNDRKRVLDDALTALKSNLAVRHGGG
jgi:hypothetical protein